MSTVNVKTTVNLKMLHPRAPQKFNTFNTFNTFDLAAAFYRSKQHAVAMSRHSERDRSPTITCSTSNVRDQKTTGSTLCRHRSA
jgi:hypothetical protein